MARPRLLHRLVVCVMALCSSVSAEDYYRPPPPPQMQRRDGGAGGGIGTLVKAGAALVCGYLGHKFILSRRRVRKLKKRQDKELADKKEEARTVILYMRQQVEDYVQQYQEALEDRQDIISKLEQVLYKLPDNDNNGLIDRQEFNKYMADYRQKHPQLTERDMPIFEDMDHNRDGHITLKEWQVYQEDATAQQYG